MKKFIIPLFAVLLFASCNDSKKDQEISALKEEVAYLKDSVAASEAPSPGLVNTQAASHNTPGFNVFLTGSIGICREAQLTVNVGEGTVMLAAQERDVRFKSYDSNTHQLIYEAFYEGEYIGDYVGTYADGSYKGVFTNIKNGGKVNFDLRDFED